MELFIPNTDAREFYAREQYSDRVIDMVKSLQMLSLTVTF